MEISASHITQRGDEQRASHADVLSKPQILILVYLSKQEGHCGTTEGPQEVDSMLSMCESLNQYSMTHLAPLETTLLLPAFRVLNSQAKRSPGVALGPPSVPQGGPCNNNKERNLIMLLLHQPTSGHLFLEFCCGMNGYLSSASPAQFLHSSRREDANCLLLQRTSSHLLSDEGRSQGQPDQEGPGRSEQA